MSIRYGGAESPEGFGFRITAEAPIGTDATTPVLPGQLFKLGGTDADGSGYKAAAAVDNDDEASVVLLQAMQRSAVIGPMTFAVLGHFSQIRRLKYKTGAAPSLGQSIQISSVVTQVDGKAFNGTSYVLYVDTANEEVEVLC